MCQQMYLHRNMYACKHTHTHPYDSHQQLLTSFPMAQGTVSESCSSNHYQSINIAGELMPVFHPSICLLFR